jgi:hypothetical protein
VERAAREGWAVLAELPEVTVARLGGFRDRPRGGDILAMARRVWRTGLTALEALSFDDVWRLWKLSIGELHEEPSMLGGRRYPALDTSWLYKGHWQTAQAPVARRSAAAGALWESLLYGRCEREWIGRADAPAEKEPLWCIASSADESAVYAAWLEARGRAPAASIVREVADLNTKRAALPETLREMANRLASQGQFGASHNGSVYSFWTLAECELLAPLLPTVREGLRADGLDEQDIESAERALDDTTESLRFAFASGTGLVTIAG